MSWGLRKMQLAGAWKMRVSLLLPSSLPPCTLHCPGFDTITTALSWSIMHLVTKPQIQKKIQKELGRWCPQPLQSGLGHPHTCNAPAL